MNQQYPHLNGYVRSLVNWWSDAVLAHGDRGSPQAIGRTMGLPALIHQPRLQLRDEA
jgi:hypothetical protein